MTSKKNEAMENSSSESGGESKPVFLCYDKQNIDIFSFSCGCIKSYAFFPGKQSASIHTSLDTKLSLY